MPEPLARILIADDEADLRALLERYLGDQGYAVRTVEGAAPLDRLLARERFDVLVLDVMMPGEDGLAVCRRLRAQGETIPIVMLTARGDPVDRIVGLEMGADDYLPKPFNPRELLARIQALVRRQRMLGAHGGPMAEDGELRFGAHVLHLGRRTLHKGDAEVPLTTGEFGLLAAFARNAGRPLGRERLIALARGRDHEATDRSIDVQVMRLRKLIEADPAQPRHIRTVWGVGYVFVPEPQ
ncbi:MAG: two-component system response regulator OmpR [Rhodocyclaceae bacterium]|nr:two-component system response regulator OmpR [Pseudomonadota bacterium]MDQ7972326.1 two-component system response regulator OmpR [Rhodocyclaceae bacterium]MDQ7999955.1 two-component system response regulator OmpR [Pseudomonadota bacterium]MDQ8016042.1 two-component system response regulator OmpR [Pseudomonadota bacterium]